MLLNLIFIALIIIYSQKHTLYRVYPITNSTAERTLESIAYTILEIMDSKEAVQTPTGNDRDLKIESNQINVSNRKNQAFYVYLCKKTLEQHEELVLHALGNATSVSVVAAEKLVRNGYAEYVSLITKTIEVEESRRNQRGKGG